MKCKKLIETKKNVENSYKIFRKAEKFLQLTQKGKKVETK